MKDILDNDWPNDAIKKIRLLAARGFQHFNTPMFTVRNHRKVMNIWSNAFEFTSSEDEDSDKPSEPGKYEFFDVTDATVLHLCVIELNFGLIKQIKELVDYLDPAVQAQMHLKDDTTFIYR